MKHTGRHPLLTAIYKALGLYPAPSNLNYAWNFGVYALICLLFQVISGIFLAMHYSPDISNAFNSVDHIMRDVNYGWLMRYVHANGASMFFAVVYIHTFRGLYYGSYVHPRQLLWIVGVAILLPMIVTAFLGYVSPWGQMSFWGATVITNLFSAVPYFGQDIVIWLWGGYAIENATLVRFFSLHYILPIIMIGLVALHLYLLHQVGPNNPLGVEFIEDDTKFYPYYVVKDLYGVIIFLMFYSSFVFFAPDYLSHPDNYIPANPLVTPPHIVPEWYFLPFYAILRSIPNKLWGVMALGGAILSLFLVPIIHKTNVRAVYFKPVVHVTYWIFVSACVLPGWVGSMPVRYPYVFIGQVCTFIYFGYFLIFLPILEVLERYFWRKRRF